MRHNVIILQTNVTIEKRGILLLIPGPVAGDIRERLEQVSSAATQREAHHQKLLHYAC